MDYNYFSRLSWFRADAVNNAKVMVVGCGALGNEVLKNLALFGIGHIVVVDFDKVESGNLTRSILFREDDALHHRFKVDVAVKRLSEIAPNIDIQSINGDICYDVGLGLLREMDVVISCLDSRYARYALCRQLFRVDTPMVDGGINELEGTARVFKLGEDCYGCNLGEMGLREMSQRHSCSASVKYNSENNRVATTPIIASIIGAVQAQEAIKLIHKEELEQGVLTSLCGKTVYWEGEHLTSKIIHSKGYDDDCPLHNEWKDVIHSRLSYSSRIDDALDEIERIIGVSDAKIVLSNRSFVESLHSKQDAFAEVDVLLPSFKVATYIEQNSEFNGVPFSAIYQKEHKVIDRNFNYKHFTLAALGIPRWDIIKVEAQCRVYYIELGGDAINFNYERS